MTKHTRNKSEAELLQMLEHEALRTNFSANDILEELRYREQFNFNQSVRREVNKQAKWAIWIAGASAIFAAASLVITLAR